MSNKDKPEHAFILAAGEGSRLRPHTNTMPKPMVPINGRPILDYTVEKLAKDGIKNITINLFYLGDRIENYFKDCSTCNIHFSKETALLDTGGGVKNALETMQGKPFYLINGDAFWSESDEKSAFDNLAENWRPDVMDILILLQPVDQMTLTEGVGDYDLAPNGQAKRSKDKTGTFMFAGIRITKPEVFENSPDGPFSFLELMDKAEARGRLHGVIHEGEWHHISTPQDLERVNQSLAQEKASQTA